MDDGSVHIDRTMALVAVEGVVAELKGPGAIDLLAAIHAGIEQRERH